MTSELPQKNDRPGLIAGFLRGPADKTRRQHKHQTSIFDGGRRLQMTESIDLTVQSLLAHAVEHDHWCIAWSGGKDSTATLTMICWLLDCGRVPRPNSLTVFYADTRMELPPLAFAALQIMEDLRERGIHVRVVMAPIDKRYFVYILGRGVPPPNNRTLRWCTRQIKVDPMVAALEEMLGVTNHALMITGVRQGESAMRDARIEMSCSKDGAECGQGWYQQVLPNSRGVRGRIATLAPLLHWRVCHVWEWLKHWAPTQEYGDWSTSVVADAYGGDEAEEINARTGCIGCPLAQEDRALLNILRNDRWAYLAPLMGLKPLYRELREPQHRIRKTGYELLKDGSIPKNPQRMGPLTMSARRMGLERVLSIQSAVSVGGPAIDLINADEEARIRELIAAETWPNGWSGEEPLADCVMDTVYQSGAVQPLLSAF